MGNPLNTETIRLIAGRVEKIRVARRGGKRVFELTYNLGGGRTQTAIVDRVILATGFRSRTGDFIADLLPEGTQLTRPIEQSGLLSLVKGKVEGSNKVVNLAKRIPEEEVYFIGPAAGDDLPAKSARAGISENGASLFNLIPRTTALARGALVDAVGLTPVRPLAQKVVRVANKSGAEYVLSSVVEIGPVGKLPEGYEVFTSKMALAKTLDGFRFDGVKQLRLTFSQVGGELLMESSMTSSRLANALAENSEFLSLARSLTAGGRPVTYTAQIRTSAAAATGLEKGAVRFDTFTVSY